ncbi:MAG: semialdehyde dehydrogenase, partial [Halieaceae bacterium]
MTTVALLGAGGKMGVRLAANLAKSDYETLHVEVSPLGQARLKEETGLDCVSQADALEKADAVI